MFRLSLSRRPLCHVFPAITFALTSLLPAFPARCFAGQAATEKRLLVVYREGTVPIDAERRTRIAGARLVHRHERFGTALIAGDSDAERTLQQDPEIEFVVEDRLVPASQLRTLPVPTASAPRLALPQEGMADSYGTDSPQGWAVRAVGATPAGAWATTSGKGVRIAVLDSGVDRTHPDIAPNLGLNMTEVQPGDQPSACDDGSPQDQSGHGTWVASLAAAAAGPATGRTIGVAPAATLLNIKVLQRMPGTGSTVAQQCGSGQASGLLSWVLQGIDDAITQRADVIVLAMSLTLDLYSGDSAGVKASFDRVTHAASEAGAVLVAAAGNDAFDLGNPRYVEMPAQARDVLAVVASTNPACQQDLRTGATCAAGPATLPYYSNFGQPLRAVAAPGGSYPLGSEDGVSGWVRGACSSGLPGTTDGVPTDANHSMGCFNTGHQPYMQALGTSAAAPLAAGVVALVRSAHPEWSASSVIAAVRASAVPTVSMAYGVVDAVAALAYRP